MKKDEIYIDIFKGCIRCLNGAYKEYQQFLRKIKK